MAWRMLTPPIRYRRARRVDFPAIDALLRAAGAPEFTPDRAMLRRFRRLVADLGADLYVAEIDARLLGVVHVTYARTLIGQRAHLELLVVAGDARGRGIGRGLVTLAAQRARRRGCAVLCCVAAAAADGTGAFLSHTGWRGVGEQLEFDLTDAAQ
jgi:N-acetylglutamate synthase-like GNAT family acetyltransferase